MPSGRSRPVDLAIVGAGPAGLYGAYCAGFRGLSVAVFDALAEPGGELAALYPEKTIYDVAGFVAVRARDLVDSLVAQARTYDPLFRLGEAAQTLTRGPDPGFAVGGDRGIPVPARAVLVTAGIGRFRPRRLPGAEAFEGRGLHYFVPDPTALAGQDVLIVGGGDSSLDWARCLQPVCRSVTLVHRRSTFRAHEASVAALRHSSVRVLTPYVVAAVRGDAHGITAVEVTRVGGEAHHEVLDVQAVVAALGFTADLGPIESWGMRLVKRRIAVDSTMATSLPGVFAAGDVVHYRGKVRLLSVSFGEAATAVNNLVGWLDPARGVYPPHSPQAPSAAH